MYTDILQEPYHQELGLQLVASDSEIHGCNVWILKCKEPKYTCVMVILLCNFHTVKIKLNVKAII